MSDTVIRVENLGKLYRLGEIGTGTISHDLNRWWASLRGKEDPFAKVGQLNDRTQANEGEYVWALKDINFEVRQGEVLGIIGRNGAGKSTLLKILSKVTTPTTGQIKVKGRIASLLEVGTGFHPELTGRENIFLNGAILGMTKAEITKKFDEIVDFAGIERYIDTPVKRYSSGMYVRLAFAVAAFLEPEVLIVDEVLAVGDAEFQRKCLGRMQDVSKNDGRTVLFVSHQMDAISRLCNRTIVLNQGRLEYDGATPEGIGVYYNSGGSSSFVKWDNNGPGNEIVVLQEVEAVGESGNEKGIFDIRKPVGVRMRYKVKQDDVVLTHGLNLFNNEGIHVLSSHDTVSGISRRKFKSGIYEAIAWIPGNMLAEGLFTVSIAMMSYEPYVVHFHEHNTVTVKVVDTMEGDSARGIYGGYFPGVVRPILKWETNTI